MYVVSCCYVVWLGYSGTLNVRILLILCTTLVNLTAECLNALSYRVITYGGFACLTLAVSGVIL